MAVSSVFRWSVLACGAALLAPVWGQQAAAPVAPPAAARPAQPSLAPTRLQRCQAEVASLQGPARKRGLSECLVNRIEGERIVARNCTRQFRDMPAGGTTLDKATFHKQCVEASLAAGHDKVARRPAAPSSSTSTSTSTVAKPLDKATLVQAQARPPVKAASAAALKSTP